VERHVVEDRAGGQSRQRHGQRRAADRGVLPNGDNTYNAGTEATNVLAERN
jgi:hypothetical protein